jgi:hypothetical protein
MIVINLFGGLGNQLFQLTAGFVLSKITNKKMYINESLASYFRFSHEKINLSDIFVLDLKKTNQNSYIKILIKKLILIFPIITIFQKFLVNEVNYSKILKKKFSKIEMLGYWQDFIYFNIYKNEIIKLFKFKKLNVNEKLLDKILKTNSASIHIRRGDFVSKKNKVSYALPTSYYMKSIRKLSALETNIIFFIFTDDKAWVRNNFLKHLKKLNYSVVMTEKNYQDFFLMSKCKHNIISNSTFSWWAAFLNKNIYKKVFYPRIWFKNSIGAPNIFDKKWIKI